MKPRIKLLAVGLLSFLLLPVLSKDAHAIPVDDSVDIVWQNVRFTIGDAMVTGGNFLTSYDDLDDVVINIAITTLPNNLGVSSAPASLSGFELILSVGSSLADIENNPAPLQLKFAAGHDAIGGDFSYPAIDYSPSGASYELTGLHLSDFQNFDQLPNLPTLAFHLTGGFFGDVNFSGNDLPSCDDPERPSGYVCPAWPGQVKITVQSTPPSTTPPTTVPEPSSFALLFLGGASVAGLKRRLR